MKKERDPLNPQAWLKILRRDGCKEVIAYGSRSEAFSAYAWLIGAEHVEHVEVLDKRPEEVKS